MLHAVPLARHTQVVTPPADFGPLARAARSFVPRFTQLRHGARSFFSDPREGPTHLPARLMLHAVFGASETACTVPHLRVAWGRTACTVSQLRVAWGRTACTVSQLRVAWGRTACTVRRDPAPGPNDRSILSLTSSPATHIAAPRQPNRSLPIGPRRPNHPLTLTPGVSLAIHNQ